MREISKSGPVGFEEVFRDSRRQQKLYDEKKGEGERKPGTSEHEAGYAFDLAGSGVNRKDVITALNKNFVRNVSGERWHWTQKSWLKMSDDQRAAKIAQAQGHAQRLTVELLMHFVLPRH